MCGQIKRVWAGELHRRLQVRVILVLIQHKTQAILATAGVAREAQTSTGRWLTLAVQLAL